MSVSTGVMRRAAIGALMAGAAWPALVPGAVGAQEGGDPILLHEVVVGSGSGFLGGVPISRERGYEPRNAGSVAARADLPARQVPFTINQATAELIEDRGDTNVYDVFENFAGATTQSTNSDTGSNVARGFFSRGFDLGSGGTVLYNGRRVYGVGSNYRSTISLAGVDLLKGPAAIYYGASEPGGVINYEFKKPLVERRVEIGARGDSEGSYGAFIDAGGPFSATSEAWRYRFVAEYDRQDDWRDVVKETPKTVFGSVEWEPTPDFATRLTYEHLKVDGVPFRFDSVRLADGSLVPVPDGFFAGSSSNFVDIRQHTVLLENEWRLTDAVSASSYALYQHNEREHETTRIGGRGGGVPDRLGRLPRTAHVGNSEDESFAAGTDLSGEFVTGEFGHQWLAGYAYSQLDSYSAVAQVSTTGNAAVPLRPLRPTGILPFAPDNGPYPFGDRLRALATQPGIGRGGPSDRTDHNVYVQDIVTMPWQTTKFVGALGYAHSRQRSGPAIGVGTLATEVSDGFLTPRLAVIQDVTPATSVYASYGESFVPQLIVNRVVNDNVLDDPETGRQYEAGLKHELFGGAALFSLAGFHIEKENIARRIDPTDDANTDSVLDGVQRSQGFEVGLTGQITDRWSSYMGYALLDTKVVESDDPLLRGFAIPYVARHNLALWNKFEVIGDPTDRFGRLDFGFGVNHYSEGRDPTGFIRPSYTLVDIGFFAEKELASGTLLKGAVRVENLFDEDYFDQRSFGSSVTFGDPRRVTFRLSTVF